MSYRSKRSRGFYCGGYRGFQAFFPQDNFMGTSVSVFSVWYTRVKCEGERLFVNLTFHFFRLSNVDISFHFINTWSLEGFLRQRSLYMRRVICQSWAEAKMGRVATFFKSFAWKPMYILAILYILVNRFTKNLGLPCYLSLWQLWLETLQF